jgi:hypothetical protein
MPWRGPIRCPERIALSAASAANRASCSYTSTKAWSFLSSARMRPRAASTIATGESRPSAISAESRCTGRKAGSFFGGGIVLCPSLASP